MRTTALVFLALSAAFVAAAMAIDSATTTSAPTSKEISMTERKDVITMKGNPLTLVGNPVQAGAAAPDFTAVANDLSPVKLSGFRGKVVILSSVPSLDTSVCSLETRKFNEQAAKLGDGVVVLTISMDLPFAQKRWCAAEGIQNVQTISDHRDAAFGMAYGELIKELRLLARAVFVVDRQGKIVYMEQVRELTHEPDYDAALAAAAKAAGR
jgi:thiol peroxidase